MYNKNLTPYVGGGLYAGKYGNSHEDFAYLRRFSIVVLQL